MTKKKIKESELILNPDGSIYHLHLKPEDIAQTIITVGDQDRVEAVSTHFDSILFKTQKREFKTHTGLYKNKKISVISTGIGVDNIDIVLNELDALVNIDFQTRQVKDKLTSLDIIRIGTSGGIQDFIGIDSFVLSKAALGFDGLLHYYKKNSTSSIPKDFLQHLNLPKTQATPYLAQCSKKLATIFESDPTLILGITATNLGFYAPQGRAIRLQPCQNDLLNKITCLEYQGLQVTNLEMETSALYALANLLGHHALSLNAIIANRVSKQFSSKPKITVDRLIQYTLDKLAHD